MRSREKEKKRKRKKAQKERKKKKVQKEKILGKKIRKSNLSMVRPSLRVRLGKKERLD